MRQALGDSASAAFVLHRGVLLRTVAALGLGMGAACPGGGAPSDRSAQPEGSAAVVPPPAPTPAGAASLALGRPSPGGLPELVDDSVGWQRRDAPTSPEDPSLRHPATYLQLRYASLDDPKLFDLILDGMWPLRDLSIVASGEELCHPSFVAAIARRRPDRLLLRVEAPFDEAHVQCLAALETDAFMLSMCPRDHMPHHGNCDGDQQLALLAASPLRSRVRALAIGFDDHASWPLLMRFDALEYLTVRDEALRDAGSLPADVVCAQSSLRYVDLFDAQSPGAEAALPWACIRSLHGYAGWHLPFDDELRPPEPGAPAGECALRMLQLWSLSDAARAELQPCHALTSLEVLQ